MSALDTQIGGSHYKDMPIQPMEFSMANDLDACQHTIIKYVTRFRQKNGVQDLEKAKHVIDMLIEFEQKEIPPEPKLESMADMLIKSLNEINRVSIGEKLAGVKPAPSKPSDAEVSAALELLLAAGVLTVVDGDAT